MFNFHNYDSLAHFDSNKNDPRKKANQEDEIDEHVIQLLHYATKGDIKQIQRYVR